MEAAAKLCLTTVGALLAQETVAALLRLKASPILRTWSQEGRPAHSAADLAAAGGHPGLAAWLAQALLTRLLQGVSANRRVDGALMRKL